MNNYKKTTYLLIILIGIFGFACDSMDDIHKDFTEGGEKVYPGRVDSLKIYPGHGRVKLSWLLVSDQNITSCKVYWSNGTKSKEVPVIKTPYVDTIITIIDQLEEGIYSFDVYSLYSDGAMSVKEEKIGTVYGENYINSLNNRYLSNSSYNAETNKATLTWGISPINSIGSEIKYKDMSNNEKTKKISVEDLKTEIGEIALGTVIEQRTMYVPEALSIDTFYSEVKSIIVGE